MNVTFNIFTKVGTSRITVVESIIVRPTQTMFMPSHHILEGVVILHKTIHEFHSNKLDGVLLTKHFEKAYDKIKWCFYSKPFV
jgi:hypothetical protein